MPFQIIVLSHTRAELAAVQHLRNRLLLAPGAANESLASRVSGPGRARAEIGGGSASTSELPSSLSQPWWGASGIGGLCPAIRATVTRPRPGRDPQGDSGRSPETPSVWCIA